MLFTIGDVITFAVVLLVLIVFRAIDRNNRSLEKLKRFSDKIMEGLSSFVGERTTEVRKLSAELAASLRNAGEALKASRATEDQLAARAAEAEGHRKRFAEYEAGLRELAEMSARVDQNLKRLREDASFLDGLDRRLLDASRRLDAMDGAASRLGAEAAAANRQALGEARDQVLGGVAERVGSIEERVKAAEAAAKDVAGYVARLETTASGMEQERLASLQKAIDRFDAGLAERLAAAAGRAETLEDEAFARLREKVQRGEQSAEQSLERLARAVADQEADAEYRLRRLEESSADIATLSTSLKESVDRTAAGVREELAALAAELAQEWKRQIAATEEEKGRLAAGMAELAGGLDALKSKAYQDASEKLRLLEDEFFTDLRSRAAAMQEKLQSWQAEADARVGEQLSAMEHAVRERAAATETACAALQDTLKTEVDRARRDASGIFEKEIASVRDAVDTATRRMHRELEAVGGEAEAAISALKEEFTTQKEELAAATAEERTALRAEIAGFRGQLEDHRQKAEALQQRLLAKLDESHRALTLQIGETERRVKAFQGQTRLFERADSLRAGLESDIEELKKEIARLAAEKAEVSEVEAQLGRTRKLAEEVSGKLARFLAEKRRVDEMEGDFKRVLSLSRDVDLKLDSLGETNDSLQQLQAKVRQFEEMGRTVEGGFERLEQKREIIEVTSEGVDRTFQRLESLEKSVATASRDLETLGQRAQSLRGDLEALAGSKQSAEAAMEIVGKLDGITIELEQRLEKAQSAREWLARTETRFEEITRQAAEQVRLLESIVKTEAKREKGERGAPPADKREIVVKLSHQGWSVQEISRVTQISRGEVELILELAPKA